MILKSWDSLPQKMKNDSVKKYYAILDKKRKSLILKRLFDFFAAIITLTILFPLFFIIGIAVKVDSKGPVLFRQVRITQYGRPFRIFKFRTMVDNAEQKGAQITVKNDGRITRTGKILRRFRLDEIPQLFNIIKGDMTFVGTRPEIQRYVEKYSDEMMATLLLPAGVTSEASIQYRNEEFLLSNIIVADKTYVDEILPGKMKHNLKGMEDFSFYSDIKTIIRTMAVVVKNGNDDGKAGIINFSEGGAKI